MLIGSSKAVFAAAFISAITLVSQFAYSQGVDRTAYQSRYDDCNRRQNELRSKLATLKNESNVALEELRDGLYCSECKNPKSRIEREQKISFQQHLKNVGGRAEPATQAMLDKEKARYDREIHDLEVDVDGTRLDCDRIQMDYNNQVKSAQQEEARARQQQIEDQQQEQQRAIEAQQQAALEEYNRIMTEHNAQQERIQMAQDELGQKMEYSRQKAEDQYAQNEQLRVNDDHIPDLSNRARANAGYNTSNLEEEAFNSGSKNSLSDDVMEKAKNMAARFQRAVDLELAPDENGYVSWISEIPRHASDLVDHVKSKFQEKIMSYFEDDDGNSLETQIESKFGLPAGSFNWAESNVDAATEIGVQALGAGFSDDSSDENRERAEKEIIQRQIPQLFPGGSTYVEYQDLATKVKEIAKRHQGKFNNSYLFRKMGWKLNVE